MAKPKIIKKNSRIWQQRLDLLLKETLRAPLPSDLNFLLKDELRQIQSTIQELDAAGV